MKTPAKNTNPWYRVPTMWLVVLLPLTAVIGGFVTLALAVHTDDGLVEDDYYRRGKEINRVLARDHTAAMDGLQGHVELDSARHQLLVKLSARQPEIIPNNVELKFLYGTRGGLDKAIALARQPDGGFHAPLPELAPGHWNVQLATREWRLVGSLHLPGEQGVDLRPAEP